MREPDHLQEAVSAVAEFLIADAPLGDTLQRVALRARDGIPPSVAAGLTLLGEGARPRTQVFTDDIAPQLDAAQYEDDTGPCLDAMRQGRIVRVEDTAAVADRWPRFSRRAVEYGVVSTLAAPLVAGGEGLGALNLYATAGAYDEAHERDASLFAIQAAVVLANARAYWTSFDMTTGLRTALESRAVIDMAKGKIMASGGGTPDEAFALLVKASQRANVPLREVARRIVEGTLTTEQ